MLHLHRAERADGLVDALRALLADPLPDPFAPELVAVPTRGVERWVAQQLSNGLGATPGRRDGVCANVLFPSPRALLADAVAAGSGLAPGEDPWRPERTAWTLLEVVEASLGEPLPGLADARPLLDARDRSVRVHACHGRARQVEVLRDAVLHALADDPTLEPRDVIVMCPDIEAFAPLIHAAFGTGEQEPFLEVRLADRALRQTNPLLGVVARLLELAGERLTASQVLDLADRPPVRRRFGFDDDDLARAEEWVRESGVRWGLDAADRAPYKLTALSAGTWRAGLDRLLAGVALADDALWSGVLPLGVESGAIDLAGRLAELLDRLGTALAGPRRAQPLAAWAAALGAAADALAAPPEQG